MRIRHYLRIEIGSLEIQVAIAQCRRILLAQDTREEGVEN